MTTVAQWIEKAAPVAYGPLGLKPWEFGQLTFGEFYELAEGYHWRTRQEQIMTAAQKVLKPESSVTAWLLPAVEIKP